MGGAMRRQLRILLYLFVGAFLAISTWFVALTNLAFMRKAFPSQWGSAQTVLGHAYLLMPGDRADNLEKAIACYEAALAALTRETLPRVWSDAQHFLGAAYQDRIRGDRADNLEKAVAAYEAALSVQTREWAQTQNNLANTYRDRIRGDRADNLEKAIVAYHAALSVQTREAHPRNWAAAQIDLGNAYQDRIRGDRADNLEKSIAAYEAALTVRTREALPREWAQTQNNLANTYRDRIRGDRADNLEKAIAAAEAALSVLKRESLPRDWAQTQGNLANAYKDSIRGDRANNLEKAIAAYEAALSVITREAQPAVWANTQNSLGTAYQDRIRGERADSLEKAIAAYDLALTVFTREAVPYEWARTQNNLATAFQDRVRGDRADNLEKALAHLEAALTVRTREALPRDWAFTQANLANAFQTRVRGERADNLEKAIAAYEMALTVFTRQVSPHEWAQTQNNLASAYDARIRGDRADNLQKTIAALDAALTVRTREAVPRDHLQTGRLLGGALLEAREWRRARVAYESAREAFLLLFGQGLNEAEARDLIAKAGPVFSEAAFAAVQLGENETALALASEGRARLMAVALNLGADRRPRVAELRASIRAAERTVEATHAAGRAAAMETLIGLQQELLGLVKDAAAAPSSGPGTVHAQTHAAIANGGAVAVPIITKVGGKILIVASGIGSASTRSPSTNRSPLAGVAPSVTVLDVPDLATERLNLLLQGATKDGKLGGWLGAYSIHYLPVAEQKKRWEEWLAAVGDLGPDLWRLFGARLDAALRERGVKRGARLVWLPTGALGILPLGLAQDPLSKRRLADSYEIAYAPSLEALASAQNQLATAIPATLAAAINPTGDLSGTENEGRFVASHFAEKQRTVLEQTAATPDAVLAALKGKTHWHFASHGTFSWQDARQSALVMHGPAPLSVDRLLETDGLGRPRLVVLSACETGLYDIRSNPDEFIGLPGTFMALGAAGVLGTLWPVDDHATWFLIAKFYDLYMGASLSPPTALSRAQRWLRQATNADLQAYARAAAKQGRLDNHQATKIEQELSEEGLARSRNSALIEWIAPAATQDAAKKETVGAKKRIARPYAHPYYWAAFLHTGL
jgi:CHAT domain-containing protein